MNPITLLIDIMEDYMTKVANRAHDYLAVVFIGAGSSYGRSSNKETAIDNCMRALKDWTVYYELEGAAIKLNILDVQGWETVYWGADGFWGKNPDDAKGTKLDLPIERVERIFSSKKKRRSA